MTKKCIWVSVLTLLFSFPSSAQAADGVELRLRLFDGAQARCKWMILRNSSAANAFFRSTRASLSHMCECASTLWVAERPDAALREADAESRLSGDALVRAMDRHMREIAENVQRCVSLQ